MLETSLREGSAVPEPKAIIERLNEQTRSYLAQGGARAAKLKSRNPFDRMKETATILRKQVVSPALTWIEWQVDDDGPKFYSKENLEGGQWDKPSEVFKDESSAMADVSVHGMYASMVVILCYLLSVSSSRAIEHEDNTE